ncbi:MAG: TIGR03960 family B12-binding radical SAM protein [Clostridia bacterium]|nr:TIGR03960 family B12-binding radical SAM protein [Clostridia bacterium]
MQNLEKILKYVEKPSRYTGCELNSVVKNKADVKLRFGFCFPDTYEIGMSHLGMKVLYDVLNKTDDIWCERSFMPWVDMEEKMRENGILLYGHESKDPLKEFDVLGFTLQYEMSYTNVLAMLDLADVPLLSEERDLSYPLICAGGPCAVNPEPMVDFVDFFMVGEGEEVILEACNIIKDYKQSGKTDKQELLIALSKVEGVYVPSLYEVEYNEDNTIKSRKALFGAPETVKKRVISDMDKLPHPEDIIVPYTEVVHDRVTLEIFRGCIRGCRFCQAGFIYRPVRERSPETLCEITKRSLEKTGYDEVSLCSLSTSDYTRLSELTDELISFTDEKMVNFCLPSLRVDNFDLELAKKVQEVRKTSLTFAPEAGSQRMRDVINKNVNEEDILKTSKLIFENGWNRVKLYFMIGLPYETAEDVKEISELAFKVQGEYFKIEKEKRPRGLTVTVSTSSFVPKPFTPFMWAKQDTVSEIVEKQQILRDNMKSKSITYNWHDSDLSIMEGVFARGDRRLSKVLYTAYKKGCKLDGWHEHFKYDKWLEAFKECGIDYTFYNHRERSYDEILPWEFIDVGVSKAFLMRENEKAKMAQTTPNCREKCSGCGITSLTECEELRKQGGCAK